MRLVPGAGGSLANGVDKSYTLEPLVVGQLDFANEVVEMPDQLAHNKSRPVWHIRSDGVDDSVGEVGIEAVPGVLLNVGRLLCVSRHFGYVKVVNTRGDCEVLRRPRKTEGL